MLHASSHEKDFFAAICHNDRETVQKLLASNCPVNTFFANGLTPLMVATRAGADAALDVLLQWGADARAVDTDGRNALNWLCRSGQTSHYYSERHTEPARKLLAAGADPYQCDTAGDSAFWNACRYGLCDVLRLIHAHFPLPLEARHTNGDTPLLMASRHAWRDSRHATSKVVELLVEMGSDCSARGADGETPLQLCRFAEYMKLPPRMEPDLCAHRFAAPPPRAGRRYRTGVRFGKKPGVDTGNPLSTNAKGNTPLHHAARQGDYAAAARLLDAGAVIDAPNRSGATPLMLAAQCGQWRVGSLLLAYGANMHQRDCQGRTPFQQARLSGNYRLLSMMRNLQN